jgi:hypothetical protein
MMRIVYFPVFQRKHQIMEAAVTWFVAPCAASARPPYLEEGTIMSTVLHKQSTSVTLRKKQMLVLMILALLTLFAVTYLMLSAVAHIDSWHVLQSLAIQYRHP